MLSDQIKRQVKRELGELHVNGIFSNVYKPVFVHGLVIFNALGSV
jgi:hypothetical protein